MYIPWKKQICKALLLLSLPLALYGCGGGGGGGGGGGAVISGVATKGPISGALVAVYRLLPDGSRGERVGSGSSASDGSYSIPVPDGVTGPLVVTVTGRPGATYTSESTGLPVPFSGSESFSAALDSVAPGQKLTVSPLTEAAFQKLPQILAGKPGAPSAEKLASSIVAANAQVGAVFGVSNILADPAGDATYRTALYLVDQMVEDSKAPGGITDTSGVMALLNQAFAEVSPSAPAFQEFVEVLDTAAQEVKSDNPPLASSVDAITQQAANPPAEPDYSDTTAPTVPAGLSAATFAINSTKSSVVLSWNPSADGTGVAGYDVYRDGNRIATVAAPGYTDPSLASNVTYSYRVVAFDGAGNRSAASEALSVQPTQPSLNVVVHGQLSPEILGLPQNDIYAPTAPGNLTASARSLDASSSSVTLNWGAASDGVGVAGYEVYRDGQKVGTATGTSYTDPSVPSNVAYTYYIIAFDAAGNRSIAGNQLLVKPNQASLGVVVNGQVSNDILILPGTDIVAPSAPGNLTAVTSALNSTVSSVALSWSAAGDNVAVTGYEVFRNGTKIATVTATGYTDPSVTSSVSYSYTVKALDAAGNRSAASAPLAVTPNQASLGVTVNGQVHP